MTQLTRTPNPNPNPNPKPNPNPNQVATVQAFEAHLDMIVACAEAFYGGDGGGVGQEEALRQRGRAHMLRDEGLDLLAEIDAGLLERL